MWYVSMTRLQSMIRGCVCISGLWDPSDFGGVSIIIMYHWNAGSSVWGLWVP